MKKFFTYLADEYFLFGLVRFIGVMIRVLYRKLIMWYVDTNMRSLKRYYGKPGYDQQTLELTIRSYELLLVWHGGKLEAKHEV